MGGAHHWGARLLLVLVGVGGALLAIELGLRLHAVGVLARTPYRLSSDARRLFEVKPHADAETNALGFRDREREARKAPGVLRIVVLGDSVTLGHGVAVAERFTERLEVLLGQHGRRVEVVNLGQRQYTTAQEAAVFETIGSALAPDLLIIAYVLNDPTADGHTNAFFRRQQASLQLWPWLVERSRRWWYRPRLLPDCRAHDYYSRMHCDADRWAASEAALDHLAARARAMHLPVLLVIFPLLERHPEASFASYPWRETHRQVGDAARRRGFTTLDLLPAFAAARPAELRAKPLDELHPNALGHRLAAEAIGRTLLDTNLLGRGAHPGP